MISVKKVSQIKFLVLIERWVPGPSPEHQNITNYGAVNFYQLNIAVLGQSSNNDKITWCGAIFLSRVFGAMVKNVFGVQT